MIWHALQVVLILAFFCCSGTKQPSRHVNRYGRPYELLYQYSSMPSLGIMFSSPSIIRPTTVALLQMNCLLAIFLNPGGSSLACERDLIMAEVYRKLWHTLIIILTLQYAVNLREQRQFFVSAVSDHTTAGALAGSSSNWSAQKIAEAVIHNWIVLQ